MKLRHRHPVLRAVGLGCLVALCSGIALAADGLSITAFPDHEIEVRVDGKYEYLPGSRIAKPPVEVLEVDGANYLRIVAADGRTLWVNRADVVTSDMQRRGKRCQSLALAQPEDSVVLGVRKLGDNCE